MSQVFKIWGNWHYLSSLIVEKSLFVVKYKIFMQATTIACSFSTTIWAWWVTQTKPAWGNKKGLPSTFGHNMNSYDIIQHYQMVFNKLPLKINVTKLITSQSTTRLGNSQLAATLRQPQIMSILNIAMSNGQSSNSYGSSHKDASITKRIVVGDCSCAKCKRLPHSHDARELQAGAWQLLEIAMENMKEKE